jgi:hypothetical protein
MLQFERRTTIQRSDFELAGNSMEFNTSRRTLVGDVKVIVHGRSHFGRPEGE